MFNSFSKNKNSRISVYIMANEIGFGLVKKNKKQISLENSYFINSKKTLLADNSIKNKIELTKLLKKELIKYKNTPINFSFPSNFFSIKNISIPYFSEEETRIIALQEAEKILNLKIDEYNLNINTIKYSIKKNNNSNANVLITAIKKQTVKDICDICNNLNLKISSIDLPSFSNFYLFANEKWINNQEKTYVSVHIDREDADITIIKEREPLFVHSIPIDKELREKHKNSIDFAKYISQIDICNLQDKNTFFTYKNICFEIEKTLSFYKANNSESENINKIILSGCGSCISNLDKFIEKQINIKTEKFESLKKINAPKMIKNDNLLVTCLSSTIGLGIKGLYH